MLAGMFLIKISQRNIDKLCVGFLKFNILVGTIKNLSDLPGFFLFQQDDNGG
jgi:hypothetical protein